MLSLNPKPKIPKSRHHGWKNSYDWQGWVLGLSTRVKVIGRRGLQSLSEGCEGRLSKACTEHRQVTMSCCPGLGI